MAHSSTVGKVIAVPEGARDTQINVYKYEFLSFEESIQLPQFTYTGDQYAGHGRFIFFSSKGDKYFVLVQADSSSSYLNDYGVVTYTESGAVVD